MQSLCDGPLDLPRTEVGDLHVGSHATLPAKRLQRLLLDHASDRVRRGSTGLAASADKINPEGRSLPTGTSTVRTSPPFATESTLTKIKARRRSLLPPSVEGWQWDGKRSVIKSKFAPRCFASPACGGGRRGGWCGGRHGRRGAARPLAARSAPEGW